jgi:hypothetical protein
LLDWLHAPIDKTSATASMTAVMTLNMIFIFQSSRHIIYF